MRERLKGINRSVKRLADGTVKTFWYAWRGGPRLPGKPGDPEFMAAYQAAMATKTTLTAPGTMMSVLVEYQQSSDFTALKASTRDGYAWHLAKIEREFGDFPLAALADPRSRDVFLKWRDKIARMSPRQADYGWQVVKMVLNWAKDRGKITHNPCEKGGKLYQGTRADMVWTMEDEAKFLATAHPLLHLPLHLGLWTGQRQLDLLKLSWFAYDGTYIRLKQPKTNMRVTIPVGAPLKAAIDATRRIGPTILVNHHGDPWLTNTIGRAWREACAKAGIVGLTFHDLRGTAVTR